MDRKWYWSLNNKEYSDIIFNQAVGIIIYRSLSILFRLTDFDPCINISCNYFAICKAFGPRDARCICVDNCPSYEEPVCSSNGTTYDNECVFQREMCHLKANFTLYHPGDCTGNGSKFTLDGVTNDHKEYHRLQRLIRLTWNENLQLKISRTGNHTRWFLFLSNA